MDTSDQNRSHDQLRACCTAWTEAAGGRALHGVLAGPGWVRLLLAGQDRLSLLLVCRPGCRLGVLWSGKLPGPVHAMMKPRRDHPLVSLLAGHTLATCRAMRDDRVAVLHLSSPDGRRRTLLHQVFGARGNLVLLDDQDVLMWADHRPPHAVLTRTPGPRDLAPESVAAPGATAPHQAMGRLARYLADDLARTLSASLRRRRQSAARLVENLARDLAEADRGREFRRKAETLAARLHLIRPGQDRLETPDVLDGTPLDIPLDPALSPAANLAAWFKRAAKADKGRQIIRDRLDQARLQMARADEMTARLEELQAGEREPLAILADLIAWSREHPDLMPAPAGRRPGRSPYGPEQPARPFRRYLVENRWEVWVGRNNHENDELTHRASHLKDIWLHAQGVAGSHVILRTDRRPDQVPRRIIAKAAALAALHSKARHAGLVPVVWTERRYVRKPRKGAPGLAVCLREKTIMVAPGIGADVEAC